MKITDIKIRITNNEEDKLKAVASVVFDDEFVVHGVKFIDGRDGLFISMPRRKTKEGSFVDIFHPIKNDVREELSARVLEVYNIELSRPHEEI